MRIFLDSRSVAGATRGCVLTIGNFDGLHLGHQALLDAAAERARELGRPTALYTFEPHPQRVLYPDRSLPRLMSWDQLVAGLEERGMDYAIREPFTREFATLSAETFVNEVIAARVQPTEIFVGRDFHFGRGREGSGKTLSAMGPDLGVRIEVIDQVKIGSADVSSTAIRRLLAESDVEGANRFLGRPYEIRGRVAPGAKRGRGLGFPTANLQSENELLPGPGVYATTFEIHETGKAPSAPLASVTNVGTRPTFGSGELLAEVHALDFEGDLYGLRLGVHFHAHLRGEQRFPSPEALSKQIAVDVESARRILAPILP